MFQKRNVLFILLFVVSLLQGQTRIKTMFYNTLNYNSNAESVARTPHLKTILDEVKPDLFMVCELKNETASNYLFNNAIVTSNPSFKKADFNTSRSPATDLLQMVYYNADKLTLEFNEVIPTGVRDINHYTLKLKTASETRIEVFVTHLKASRGIDNRQKREESIEIFTRQLDRLPQDAYVIFAGDFNFYTSNEEGFLKLIDENNPIQIIDPINRLCPSFPDDGKDYYDVDYDNTYFWNNSSFSDVHSQSTRSSQLNGDGAGGGMDDRFDFIMLSKNLTESTEMKFVNNSYKTIGNNGNCYNSFVSNTSCTGEFSQNLRNALFNFSDHLPIVLELENQQNILSNYTYVKKLNFSIKHQELKLKIDKNIKEIKIYNTLGKVVFTSKNINSNETVIHLNILNNGLYFLKVDDYKVAKFLKI
ncbi:T9SS type A sorting domain-containing protein [Polaribacter marinivivus]|uniref:T9SS type A sorting domain-containing protein n=1 Tax=Polaribacter marinivivus TaxID=1524260 RepID=A0ABV8RBP9_9FLAO